MKNKNPIILIEDDQIVAMTVKRIFEKNNIPNRLDIIGNGEEALKHLTALEENPFFVLLDLNMPKTGGIEFLKIARQEGLIKKTPVVVLTSSNEYQDRVDSFDLGVCGYMLKPTDFQKFSEMIRTIYLYWTLNEFPYEV